MTTATDKGLKQRIDRATKLLELSREHWAKAWDCLEEARKVLSGEQGIGDRLRELSDFWCVAWEQHHGGEKYAWGPEAAKNAQLLKRLCAAERSNDEIERRMIAYLEDRDVFVANNKHRFGFFYGRYNQYVRERHSDWGGHGI